MFKASRYTKTLILADEMLKDFSNTFRVTSVRAYKGSLEHNLPAGTTFGLQITVDNSETKYDKETHQPIENNLYETIDVTIPGYKYPGEIQRGDFVAIRGFMPDVSYYIDHKLILRFEGIQKLQRANSGSNAKG